MSASSSATSTFASGMASWCPIPRRHLSDPGRSRPGCMLRIVNCSPERQPGHQAPRGELRASSSLSRPTRAQKAPACASDPHAGQPVPAGTAASPPSPHGSGSGARNGPPIHRREPEEESMPAQRTPETDTADRVGHDLRTPLTLIRGYAEALRDEGSKLSSEQRAWVEAILRGAERLETAVEQL